MTINGKSVFALGAVVALVLFGGLTLAAQGQGQGSGYGRGNQQQRNTLEGTYELDGSVPDTSERAAQQATRRMPAGQRDEAYRTLVERLQAPEMLSIERNGTTVTMASTNGEPATFEADGRNRRETVRADNAGVYGQTTTTRATTTRATFIGERLTVTSQGNRATDFVVTFEPQQNGERLLVTRQIYNANYATPVVVRSYYDRVSIEPRWDLYTDGNDGYPDAANPNTTYDPRDANRNPRDNRTGFIVPEGTRIFAILDSPIDTRTARVGDRFTMTVQGPNEYRDARIEGVIRSSSVSSTDKPADLMIDFDTIRTRNGQTAPINATLDSVRKPGGEVLRVDPAGQTERTSNTSRTVENSAIGAAIGGVIGVITGGKKGAVIGAVIGGAAGAGGSILANQRDRFLDLPVGTEVTLVASSPRGGN